MCLILGNGLAKATWMKTCMEVRTTLEEHELRKSLVQTPPITIKMKPESSEELANSSPLSASRQQGACVMMSTTP
eukprot:6477578-Amphidinium_carterae.1